jgi:ISXO2-like transposase domain
MSDAVEGIFSVFKRGLVGTYQHIGEQHVDHYLAEFDFRANNRAKMGVTDDMRAGRILKGAEGKRLTYRQHKTPRQTAAAFIRWRKAKGYPVAGRRRPPWKRWYRRKPWKEPK